jgi:hypothetical protein
MTYGILLIEQPSYIPGVTLHAHPVQLFPDIALF